MKMDMQDGGQARRGKIEKQYAPPSIKHKLCNVKTSSKDKWVVLGISRTHIHLFLYPYSFALGIWILLAECQSPWQLHALPWGKKQHPASTAAANMMVFPPIQGSFEPPAPCHLINSSSILLLASQLPAFSQAASSVCALFLFPPNLAQCS